MLHAQLYIRKKVRILSPAAGVLLVCFLAFILFPAANGVTNIIAAPAPSDTTLNITASDLTMLIASKDGDEDGTFSASTPAEFSVYTNNYTGYTLGIKAEWDDEDATRLVDGDYAFDSITAATPDGDGFEVGNWGIRPSKFDSLDNTNFLPAPTHEGFILDVTKTANTEASQYTLELGAKVDDNTPLGNYSNAFAFSAMANPVGYTITFDKNTDDEVENMPSIQSGELAADDIIISAKVPTRVGYTFANWCDGEVSSTSGVPSCDGTVYEPGSIFATSMQTPNLLNLSAMWEVINYNISYNLDGGAVVPINPLYYNIETNTFTLNNPTKNGYTFTGWTGSNGDTPETTVTVEKGTIGEKSYTAHWQVINYSISYNLNGGSVATANPTSYNIESSAFTLTNPTRNGYTFKGWSGTGLSGDENTVVTVGAGNTGDRAYTANWTANKFYINYAGNGNTGGTMNQTECTYDQDCNLRTNAFSKTGYGFNGWKYNNTAYSNGANVKNIVTSGTITMTAQWTANTFTIQYAGNGNTGGTMANTGCTYDQNCSLRSNAFSKTGYTFAGWSYGGKTYSNGANVKNIVTSGTITMTARWTANTYSVTLNRNGGSGGTGSVTATYGSAMPGITKPSKKGYTFQGYYDAASGGTQYYNASGGSAKNWDKTSATTLYAHWTLTWTKIGGHNWAWAGTARQYLDAESMCSAVGGTLTQLWRLTGNVPADTARNLWGTGIYWVNDDYADGKGITFLESSGSWSEMRAGGWYSDQDRYVVCYK